MKRFKLIFWSNKAHKWELKFDTICAVNEYLKVLSRMGDVYNWKLIERRQVRCGTVYPGMQDG